MRRDTYRYLIDPTHHKHYIEIMQGCHIALLQNYTEAWNHCELWQMQDLWHNIRTVSCP